MDKKHEPIYCWNSDKTYSILSGNKVLIQLIICLYSVLSFTSCTTRQGKVSFQETLNFRTGMVGLSQCFFSMTPVFCGRISFPLQLLHWCTKIACYASVSHHCVRAELLVQRVDLADFTQAAVLQDGHGLGRTAIDGL